MTESAYNLKTWFYDLRDFEKQAQKSRARFFAYEIEPPTITGYEFKTRRKGGSTWDDKTINRIYKKQQLYDLWQRDEEQYVSEMWKRYTLINLHPDGRARALLLEHFILNKKYKDMTEDYAKSYVIHLINNALEDLAKVPAPEGIPQI